MGEDRFKPKYESWQHGGWCVVNVFYPSGACGCVSRQLHNPATNARDGQWRIVCDSRPSDHTYRTRNDAARAERDLIAAGELG